jgi:SAM-dependent methyltransferase
MVNIDKSTVDSFGEEWSYFDQRELSTSEVSKIFNEYFSIFPWDRVPNDASGFDMGCGSGRWAKLMAPKVGGLHCIDPSSALDVAKITLKSNTNVTFHSASVDEMPLPLNSQDFGYSLGVLHHVPDTTLAIKSCVDMLKPGAPFLVYLYYAFDNRNWIFKLIWKISDKLRKIICKLPSKLKHFITDIIATIIYYPLARVAFYAEYIGINVSSIPLSYYRNHSFYTMRTDSRDRFGTPLEHRFTREEISLMMKDAGLKEIKFSDTVPYWCAVGIKK